MKDDLRRQIQDLMRDLAVNGMNLRRMERIQSIREQLNLMAARTEILKSIAYRQAKLVEILTQECEYKEAA